MSTRLATNLLLESGSVLGSVCEKCLHGEKEGKQGPKRACFHSVSVPILWKEVSSSALCIARTVERLTPQEPAPEGREK